MVYRRKDILIADEAKELTVDQGDITTTNNIAISVSDGIFDKNTYTVYPKSDSWFNVNSSGIDLSDFKIDHIDGDKTGKGGIIRDSDGNFVVNIKDGDIS